MTIAIKVYPATLVTFEAAVFLDTCRFSIALVAGDEMYPSL